MSRFKPHIALLICNIVWAMDYPFYNIVLPHYVHPMAMVAGSLVVTALFSLVPLLWQKAERVARADIRKLIGAALLIGVASVLWSVWLGWRGSRRAVWFGGVGTVLTVLSLLLLAGWNDTAYYPSLADMQSSLTIRNSSSSLFTLRTMAWVSLFVPFVAAYIWYAWRAMNRRPITREEIRGDDHQY